MKLRSTKELMGYKLEAADGEIGKVKDFLFDEAYWALRWMVADTGDWLPKQKVLISPITLKEPNWISGQFPVRLTKKEIEEAPGIEADEPVSREYETKWFDHYGHYYYWSGSEVWGAAITPDLLFSRQQKAAELQGNPETGSRVLRSAGELMGYHVQARDDEIGHIEDFLVDDASWKVRYMIVDTRNWLPGRKVLVAPEWLDVVKWSERKVFVELTRDEVKQSPEYRPSESVKREYEMRLHDYYGRPIYWRNPSPPPVGVPWL